MLRALRFLLGQQGVLPARSTPQRVVVGQQAAWCYEPVGARLGTVMTVHGMTPLGAEDPRMIRLNHALSWAGFRVISPQVDSIAELRIHAGQIDTLERCIDDAARGRLCPDGKVAIFAPSFSAGLALIAAGRPRVAERVRAVCAVGTYANVRTTMQAVLQGTQTTPYVWRIVLANFVSDAVPDGEHVRDALLAAARDEWWADRGRAPALLTAQLDRVSAATRQRITTLLRDPDARRACFDRIVARQPPMLALASVVDQLDGLRARVTLLHGQHDATIPAAQSEQLAAALRDRALPHRLLVTPLLGHGGVKASRAAAHHGLALLRHVAGWIEDARA